MAITEKFMNFLQWQIQLPMLSEYWIIHQFLFSYSPGTSNWATKEEGKPSISRVALMAFFPGWLMARKAKQQQRNSERDALLGDAQDEMLKGAEITHLKCSFGFCFREVRAGCSHDILYTQVTSLSCSPTNTYAALRDSIYSESIPSACTSLFKSIPEAANLIISQCPLGREVH